MRDWLIAAAATLVGSRALFAIAGAAWHLVRSRCRRRFCLRGAAIEVSGTLWKTCARHARSEFHAELERRWRRERGSGWVTY